MFACICTQLRCANICTKFSRRNSRPPIFCLHSVFVAQGLFLEKYKLDPHVSKGRRRGKMQSTYPFATGECNNLQLYYIISRKRYIVLNHDLIESLFFLIQYWALILVFQNVGTEGDKFHRSISLSSKIARGFRFPN